MKDRILQILRREDGTVSGARISSRLNTSRVTVWKHIRKLQEHGYPISASSKGYRLDSEPDVLFPWELGRWQDRVHHYKQIGSTMAAARELARNGCSAYTVVVAERQLKGRGRLDRQWLSTAGGLYFTVVLRPQLAPNRIFRVNFAAVLALVQALKQLFDIEARVKWPNDVLVDGKKIAGMLSEFEADSDRLIYINLGLGININNDVGPFAQSAVSLRNILGRMVMRKDVLARFLENLEPLMEERRLATIVDRWKQHADTLNRQVRIVTRRDEFCGRAIDIDPDGALVLAQPDGRTVTVHYGDCFHQ